MYGSVRGVPGDRYSYRDESETTESGENFIEWRLKLTLFSMEILIISVKNGKIPLGTVENFIDAF